MGAPAPGNGGLSTPSLSTERHRAPCCTDHSPLATMVTGEAIASCWSAWTLWACTASHPVRHFVCLGTVLDGVRFLYSTSTPLDPCSTSSSQRRSVRSETLAFRVQIPRILSLGPRGLWASMRHLDYCGVWSPGEYFRVRTSLFHCRDFDILDAHSNIFSTCPLSRFLLSPFGQWTRAVCSTNAELRLKTETTWYAACGVFVGNTILSVTRQVDGSFSSASTCSEMTLSFVAVVRGAIAASSFAGTVITCKSIVSLGHGKDFFDECRVCVFPREPVKLVVVLTHGKRTCRYASYRMGS